MPVARLRPISRHVAAVDLHGRFQVAVFLVRHRDGLIAIDAGFPGWAYAILTAAKSLPEPNRVTHLVLTHAHSDHVGGAGVLASESGAQVVCSAAERPFIEEHRSLAHAARGLVARTALTLNHWLLQSRVPPVQIDGTIGEGDRLGGLRAIELPGHTPGQIALVHEEDRVVLCADAIFNVRGHLGHDPVPGLTADVAGAEESMRRLADLGLDDVAPSHGPALIGDARDRIRGFLERRD
ncbi:MAG: MBL fold metallo-hydrolase [Deltaproteobacteria bacterium]|nr:MBL fold metallo-hydrolase [Deltaproteobacteria bacterium]